MSLLVFPLPPPSSSDLTSDKEDTELPVYTARTVSKLDPMVSNVAVPEDGAVHLYQTELPELDWADGLGSDVCTVAPALLPDLEPDAPEIVVADEKLSLPGAVVVGVEGELLPQFN